MNLLLNNIFINLISLNKQPLFQTPCFIYDKTKIFSTGFVRSDRNIYDKLIYNCLEDNWRQHNQLYQEALNVLGGEGYKSYEGIIFDEEYPEANTLHIISNEESSKIFNSECNFFFNI